MRLGSAPMRPGRDPLVDVGVDRGTAEPALAKPDQALVSMDANPDQRRARGEAHRLDLGDLHRSPKHPRQRSALEPKAPSRPWTADTEAVPSTPRAPDLSELIRSASISRHLASRRSGPWMVSGFRHSGSAGTHVHSSRSPDPR